MADYKPFNHDWFVKKELTPPETISHGTDDDIRANLQPLKTSNWKLNGNQLSCDTEHGPLTQTIPSDMICLGTDNNGMPILKKIAL